MIYLLKSITGILFSFTFVENRSNFTNMLKEVRVSFDLNILEVNGIEQSALKRDPVYIIKYVDHRVYHSLFNEIMNRYDIHVGQCYSFSFYQY